MKFKCSGCKKALPYEQRAKHKCEYLDLVELQKETLSYLAQRKCKIEEDDDVGKSFAIAKIAEFLNRLEQMRQKYKKVDKNLSESFQEIHERIESIRQPESLGPNDTEDDLKDANQG